MRSDYRPPQILPARKRSNRAVRIGWISTWGSCCGIATYSDHLTRHLGLPVTIFAPTNEEGSTDDHRVFRNWSMGKSECGLHELAKQDVDVFVIQFNYNFYNHGELEKLIQAVKQNKKKIIITFHSTVDPPESMRASEFFLENISPTLALCDRLLVHSIHDLNRLKSIGLTDNVALFPHGVLDSEVADTSMAVATRRYATVATYGFALPNKGLEEVVRAVALLKAEGFDVRLLLIDAEYPDSVSNSFINDLKRLVVDLNLTDVVEHTHAFLTDAESIGRIRQADLAIFAYQHSGELASGAVRFGLSAGVPVAVTLVPIFDDLRDSVFRFDGTSPRAIADGIVKDWIM